MFSCARPFGKVLGDGVRLVETFAAGHRIYIEPEHWVAIIDLVDWLFIEIPALSLAFRDPCADTECRGWELRSGSRPYSFSCGRGSTTTPYPSIFPSRSRLNLDSTIL